MKIANALGISINVFMDFDIETVSDVLSLLLKTDKQLDMDFETEKDKDGSCPIISQAYTSKKRNCMRTL